MVEQRAKHVGARKIVMEGLLFWIEKRFCESPLLVFALPSLENKYNLLSERPVSISRRLPQRLLPKMDRL